jgi:hypothetical protein
MRVLSNVCAVVALILSLSSPSSAAAVKTTSGLIICHTVPNRTAVTEFLRYSVWPSSSGKLDIRGASAQ